MLCRSREIGPHDNAIVGLPFTPQRTTTKCWPLQNKRMVSWLGQATRDAELHIFYPDSTIREATLASVKWQNLVVRRSRKKSAAERPFTTQKARFQPLLIGRFVFVFIRTSPLYGCQKWCQAKVWIIKNTAWRIAQSGINLDWTHDYKYTSEARCALCKA